MKISSNTKSFLCCIFISVLYAAMTIDVGSYIFLAAAFIIASFDKKVDFSESASELKTADGKINRFNVVKLKDSDQKMVVENIYGNGYWCICCYFDDNANKHTNVFRSDSLVYVSL